MNNGKLKELELKKLFSMIEDYKTNNKPISWAFRDYAKQTNKKQNSIRNLYYLELASLKENPEKAKKLSIDLNKHDVQRPTPFSNEEKDNIIKKIQEYVGRGYSVRKACMMLAGGNASLMIRYQNKYRCMLSKDKNEKNNVIKMPQKRTSITDADIQSLFLGLVKLVKKNAYVEAKNQLNYNNENSQLLISKYMNEIETKDKEILALRQQLSLTSKTNEALREKINCFKAKDVLGANKKLKEFLSQKSSSELKQKISK